MADNVEIRDEDITIAIGINKEYRIGIKFERSVDWISMLPKDARELGEMLIAKATESEHLLAMNNPPTIPTNIPEKTDG